MNDRQRGLDLALPTDEPLAPPSGLRPVHLVFPDARTAEYLVAGLPLAARLIHAIATGAQGAPISVGVATGPWFPSRRCVSECRRLAGSSPLRIGADGAPDSDALVVDALDALAALTRKARETMGNRAPRPGMPAANPDQALREADRLFLLATAKPQDGLFSRTFNRPVSRSITRLVFRFAWIEPLHATAGTALIALCMLIAMLGSPAHGALIGALLFQAASVFDGVDGEIARATFRTSPAGARLDSLIDAATNLAFVAGLSANLWLRGDTIAAIAGLAGLALLLAGLAQIGRRAQMLGEPINFEAVKVHLRRKPTRRWLVDILIWLTMRDFIAFAAALLAVLGKAIWVPYIFLSVAVCWFFAITVILARSAGRR
ncbi:CDP-alcohol phosphatidyltransferase family protein [Novosphingobium sp.]|uniref:CDP-alcohol phosphatidyltransferase family protein n=1 Tax=Novosphingobium sp. TaxID=1874826 RepID=UPI003BAD32DE